MGQDPEELRKDIERRREDLGGTLDAIGDRVSPGRMIERRRNRMTEGVQSLRERVMGVVSSDDSSSSASIGDRISGDAVRDKTEGSPLGAGLVTFGIGFLVAAAMPPTAAESQAASKLQEHAGPLRDELTDAAKQVGESVKEQATEAGKEVAGSASEAAQQVKDSAASAASDTKDEATQAAQQARQGSGPS